LRARFMLLAIATFVWVPGCQASLSATAAASPAPAVPAPVTLPAFSKAFKGWELYAWQDGANWRFSLLMGTNANKSWGQISGSTPIDPAFGVAAIDGPDALLMQLARLPRGEQIFWAGSVPPNVDATTAAKVGLPAPDVQARVKAACAQDGLVLTLN
jgi:hypothetical protein